jgi:hypothetical protein
MRARSKLALISLAATVLMAFVAHAASARNLSVSNQNIRTTFDNVEIAAEGLPTTTCHVTLEGSFHQRTMTKTPETLTGFITRVTTGSCSSGLTVLSATLPWHTRYTDFSGSLPNITELGTKTAGMAFNIGALGFNCLARAEIRIRIKIIISIGIRIFRGAQIPRQTIPFASGGGFGCPASEGTIQSATDGTMMLLGATTSITVTLI